MDWSKKADEMKSRYGDALASHQAAALAFVQKKYRIKGEVKLEDGRINRDGFSEGELIEICISCGFDSTDFSGLLERMTADYYARIEEAGG